MAPLSMALSSSSGGLGSPCESPGEMCSSFRRRRAATNAGDRKRRATAPVAGHHIPGFEPSITQSNLSRRIALADVWWLKMTPLEPEISREHACAHRGGGMPVPSSPSTPYRRRRARTMPNVPAQLGVVSPPVMAPLDGYDADSEDNDDRPDIPDFDAVSGLLRSGSSSPELSPSAPSKNCERTPATTQSTHEPTLRQPSITFVDRPPRNVPPITTKIDSMDRKTSIALQSGIAVDQVVVADDHCSSSDEEELHVLASPPISPRPPRRDSIAIVQHNMPRKRVNGVNWYMDVEDARLGDQYVAKEGCR